MAGETQKSAVVSESEGKCTPISRFPLQQALLFSPLLLEYSGIGLKKVLDNAGVNFSLAEV